MVDLVRLWAMGYVSPGRMVGELRSRPAPHYGLLAQLVRGLLDALLLYLPMALLGRVPPLRSYLSFIPTERYYLALVFLAPLVLEAILIFQSAFVHLALRLLGRRSDFDAIINICGMAALIVGAVILPWDWLWILRGGVDQVWLGMSHLVISLWGVAITALGLKRTLGVPLGLAVALSLLQIPIALPLAMMFMRSPL